MSGPSGENTKASKIERILSRQAATDLHLSNIAALMRLNHDTDTATIKMLTATNEKLVAANLKLIATNRLLATVAQSLEGQLNRLRKYVGSILFKRRQLMAGTASLNDVRVPTLEPAWGGKSRLYDQVCRLDLLKPSPEATLADVPGRFRR
jgi:hypothetical protein